MALRLRKTLVIGAIAVTGLGVAVPAIAATTGRSDKISSALTPLVSDGTLTQAQADKVAETLATVPLGPGGRGGPGGHVDLDSAAVAKVLGLTEDALRTELQTKSLATIAKEKNVDVAKVVAVIVDAAKARLAAAVTAGTITQAQADKKLATLTARVTERVNSTRPAGGPGEGRGGRGPGGPGGGGIETASAAIAKVLGLTQEQLRTELRTKSLATVAKEKNVDVAQVVAAIVAEAKTRIAAKVTAGELTQAQADEKLATLTARVTERVNSVRPAGKGGPRGERPADAETPTPTPTS